MQEIVIKKIDPKSHVVMVVGTAKQPNLFLTHVNFKQETKTNAENLMSKIFTLFKSSGPTIEEKEKTREFFSLEPKRSIFVEYNNIKRLRIDKEGKLALLSVSFIKKE